MEGDSGSGSGSDRDRDRQPSLKIPSMFDAVETKEKNHNNLIYRLSGAAGVRLTEELFHPATIL